jgi:hypothetical protein
MSGIRCTNCTWRGDKGAAQSTRPPRPSVVPGAVAEVQAAYAEKQAVASQLGSDALPPCPVCGHHTVAIPRKSIRPAG